MRRLEAPLISGWSRLLKHYATRAPQKLPSLARLAWSQRSLLRSRAAPGRGDVRLPGLVTLQVNYRCNLRCVQCGEWGDAGAYKGMDPRVIRDEMATAEWEDLLDQLAEWRPYVSFFGGEPFLRGDLIHLIAFASKRGLLTAVNSNTTLMTEEKADELVRSGLDYYIASVDGPEAINNSIRRGSDVYAKVVSGVRALLRARSAAQSRLPLVEVCMTLTEENQHAIIETAELVDTWGVDVFSVQLGVFTTSSQLVKTRLRLEKSFGHHPVFWSGFLRDVSRIRGADIDAQLRILRERHWSFQLKRYPQWSIKDMAAETYFQSPETVFGGQRCHFPWKRAYILPNGDLVGCSQFIECNLGNVKAQPFAALWNGPAMKRFRDSLAQEGLFAACSRCCDLYELDES